MNSSCFLSLQSIPNLTTVTQAAIEQAKLKAQQAKALVEGTVEQTKSSLDQAYQSAAQFKTTTSEVIQTAINSAITDWLQTHPVALRLVQTLLWALNHPIVSLIILVLALALTLKLIKAIGSLIDTVGSVLLQAPFKISVALIGVGVKSLSNRSNLVAKKPLVPTNLRVKSQQQRLREILTRLEAIRQEQNELLQEVESIIINK